MSKYKMWLLEGTRLFVKKTWISLDNLAAPRAHIDFTFVSAGRGWSWTHPGQILYIWGIESGYLVSQILLHHGSDSIPHFLRYKICPEKWLILYLRIRGIEFGKDLPIRFYTTPAKLGWPFPSAVRREGTQISSVAEIFTIFVLLE